MPVQKHDKYAIKLAYYSINKDTQDVIKISSSLKLPSADSVHE